MDPAATERAAQRRLHQSQWPVRAYRIEDEPIRDPFDDTSMEERLASMWGLAKEAWAVAGLGLPGYSRAEAPGCVVRGRE